MRHSVSLLIVDLRYTQELKELAALAYRDTTNENREFWKNEMGQALRDIQQVYDDKLEATRNDVETYYNLKVRSVAHISVYNIEIITYYGSFIVRRCRRFARCCTSTITQVNILHTYLPERLELAYCALPTEIILNVLLAKQVS